MIMAKIAVIGGGAAGMLAAGRAAQRGHEVHLFEKNNRLGKKILITGKGRCNVTNDGDLDAFLDNIPGNPYLCTAPFIVSTIRHCVSFCWIWDWKQK